MVINVNPNSLINNVDSMVYLIPFFDPTKPTGKKKVALNVYGMLMSFQINKMGMLKKIVNLQNIVLYLLMKNIQIYNTTNL